MNSQIYTQEQWKSLCVAKRIHKCSQRLFLRSHEQISSSSQAPTTDQRNGSTQEWRVSGFNWATCKGTSSLCTPTPARKISPSSQQLLTLICLWGWRGALASYVFSCETLLPRSNRILLDPILSGSSDSNWSYTQKIILMFQHDQSL